MSEETTEVHVSSEESTQSRPAKKETRAKSGSRPRERTPVAGFRNLLGVYGKDPEYVYRFVLDVDENGERIQRHQAAGYEFVQRTEIDGVGQARVGSDSGSGSLVRVPSGGYTTTGDPSYLYLMRIHRDWYEEDQRDKVRRTEEAERAMVQQSMDENEGRYGDIRISSSKK